MKKFTSIGEAQADYERKQKEKVELERPEHSEKYAEKVKHSVQQSKKTHTAAS